LEPLERLELLEPFPSKHFELFERFDAVVAEAYPLVGRGKTEKNCEGISQKQSLR